MSGTILIVDDDPVQRRLLEAMVHRLGFEALVADFGTEAVEILIGTAARPVDLVVLDLVMPDLDGFGVLDRLRGAGSTVPVIVQTANGSIDAVISAMRGGALDFVVKPVGPERLQVSIRNALKIGALETEVRHGARRRTAQLNLDDLASTAAAMNAALGLARRAACSTIPVLLEGETGTGKELVARAIAASGDRAQHPFVAVNCGAIPANLAESVLFGHERGAFTGATERHIGKFQEAHGGTLFLDEVGELPAEAQVKLLRALQSGEVDPVGGRKPVRVDIRVISATNRTLVDLVRAGTFREDLYYRLGVFPVGLPPLRARREDIAALARRFLARFCAEEGRRIRSIAPAALALLQRYDWPGNVRQLENTIFRAVVLAEGDEITVADLPQIAAASGETAFSPLPAIGAPAPASRTRPGLPLTGPDGEARTLEEIERETIRHAMILYRGQMTEVARRLGIGRSTLYRKIRDMGLETCGSTDTDPGEGAALAKA